jgi:hypothetical protein
MPRAAAEGPSSTRANHQIPGIQHDIAPITMAARSVCPVRFPAVSHLCESDSHSGTAFMIKLTDFTRSKAGTSFEFRA